MDIDAGHTPHNQTELADAVSRRGYVGKACLERTDPIFPDPLRDRNQRVEWIVDMVRDRLRPDVDPEWGVPVPHAEENVLGFMDAGSRILKIIGNETWAHVLAQIRDDVERGDGDRLAALLSRS